MITRLDDKRLTQVVRKCLECGEKLRCNIRGGVQREYCKACEDAAMWRRVAVRSIATVPRLRAYLYQRDNPGFRRANRGVQQIAASLRNELGDKLPPLCFLPIELRDDQVEQFEKILSSLTLSGVS